MLPAPTVGVPVMLTLSRYVASRAAATHTSACSGTVCRVRAKIIGQVCVSGFQIAAILLLAGRLPPTWWYSLQCQAVGPTVPQNAAPNVEQPIVGDAWQHVGSWRWIQGGDRQPTAGEHVWEGGSRAASLWFAAVLVVRTCSKCRRFQGLAMATNQDGACFTRVNTQGTFWIMLSRQKGTCRYQRMGHAKHCTQQHLLALNAADIPQSPTQSQNQI